MTRKFELPRRTILKTTAAGAVVGFGAAAAMAQEDAFEGEIELGGRRSGWVGVSPEEIADERNPTLRLAEGEAYTLTWENLDGDTHNFVIEDEEGENFVSTDIVSGTGETQTVEFTAEAGMHEYYCAPHPTSMRGDIELVGGDGDAEEADDEEADEEATIETVVDISGDPTAENLAIDDEGNLYFGITDGEVRRLTPEQTLETDLTLEDAEQVAEFPGDVFGVEIAPDGTLYVALQAGEETGIWRSTADGVAGDEEEEERRGGDETHDTGEEEDETEAEDDGDADDATEAELFALVGVEDEVFPNGVEYDDERDRVLFTESFEGVVYEASPDADDPEEAATVWLEDDRLDTESFGANGLTVGPDDDLFVAVTEEEEVEDPEEGVGRVLRVPIDEDGAAGEAETLAEGTDVYGADGVEVGPDDEYLYVAAILQSEVLRVSPDGEVETLATEEDGVVFPSDVTFGTTEEQGGDLFICNYAPEEPEESAILRWSP